MLTMLVTVLMTSCQVSLQWNRGPVTIQASVMAQIAMKAELDPAALAVLWAIVANQFFFIERDAPNGTPAHAVRGQVAAELSRSGFYRFWNLSATVS
jgi:hypothetical protein